MKIKTIEQAREGRVSVQLTGSPEFFTDEVSITITVPPCGHEQQFTAPPGYDPAAAVEVMAENYQRASDRIKELEALQVLQQEAHAAELDRMAGNYAELQRQSRIAAVQRADEAEAALARIRTLVESDQTQEAMKRPDSNVDPDFLGSMSGNWMHLRGIVRGVRTLLPTTT